MIRGGSSNNNWLHFSDASNSLYHHLAGQAYNLLDNRTESINSINTLSDWKNKQDEIKGKLMDIIGPFPKKNALNAQILRTIQKDYYSVEHIVYESRPEFYVTSSLFIPNELEDQAPAILYLSGHTANGYRSETYQHKILNLVKKGFIVFAIDPVGQGERLEYYDAETGGSVVGSSTREHSYTGVQTFITGSSQANYMIWDGIRAVDYLLTRDEVDHARLGITGRSGGGTQTAYIAAMDERIHAAAPEAYITSFNYLL
ncbi:MAG: acetylxylan esterase, partial [Balneolales bacterium]